MSAHPAVLTLASPLPQPPLAPQQQHIRKFHPAMMLGGVLLKKWTVYKLGSNYGWPLVYRRLLEQSQVHVPPEHRPAVRVALKKAFRSPTQVFVLARDSHVGAFLQQLIGDGAAALPRPVRGLVEFVVDSTVGSTFGGKVVKDIHKKNAKK